MIPLPQVRIDDIKQRLEKTTKGRWFAVENTYNDDHAVYLKYAPGNGSTFTIATFKGWDNRLPDAEFVANAHGDIPFLLEELAKETARALAAEERVATLEYAAANRCPTGGRHNEYELCEKCDR